MLCFHHSIFLLFFSDTGFELESSFPRIFQAPPEFVIRVCAFFTLDCNLAFGKSRGTFSVPVEFSHLGQEL